MMNTLTYTKHGDYFLPDLTLDDMSEDIGKYGMLRKTYLKEHHGCMYDVLLLTGKLWPHLIEIDRTAQKRIDSMMDEMEVSAGITEALKAADQMEWVCRVNGMLAAAEEIVLNELVYDNPVM